MKKNKVKTKKSAAKRFKVTKKGKILFRQQGFRHLRSKKPKSWLRRKKKLKKLEGQQKTKILRLLGKK
jgi:large subunit ribosomal protein L35